jgi:cell division protein FtsQ
MVALVGWASYSISRPSTFPVRHVQLSGELGRLDMAQLREVILPHVMRGLLRLDVTKVSESVAALPWVHHATVRRVWPEVVEVEIGEEKPLARWGNTALVNEEGALFTPPESEWPSGLPVFEGPENTVQIMTVRYRELREVLAPVGLKVALLSMNERRAFSLDLENGMRLMLGRSDQQARLERFVRAYARVVEGRTLEVRKIDLRYTNGFTVVWKQHGPQA